MKIKNKLRLGFGFLFVIVLFFGATALYYIHEISENAKIILKNNYETLSYTKQMRTVLDENAWPLSPQAAAVFNDNLTKQEHNITERGEKQTTLAVREDFGKLTAAKLSTTEAQALEREIRKNLRTIEDLNMAAIVMKNEHARTSVNHATVFLGLVGGFTFLILFSFSVNFPDIIAQPLRVLLLGIREISQKNYSQRLNFNQNDEFGEVAAAFNDMAARLNEWENSNLATVMSEKLRIEAIIEQMQDAIIGVNEEQEVLFINDAARKLSGLESQVITGKKIADMTNNHELFTLIMEPHQPGTPIKITADDREYYFELESREIVVPNVVSDHTGDLSKAGSPAGMVYILKNITEFHERDEAKTNFIATISHELKTPISSIKMSAKLLNDDRIGAINREQHELVEQIKDDSDRLLKITSELLNLAQLETGNIQLNFANIKPDQVIGYAINSVKFQADQKSVEIQVVKSGDLPEINADGEKTAWVMVNLLSNALRYSTENSKIIVEVAQRGGNVEFSVKDFGKGIDEQYQRKLFDRYFQVPADQQNKSGSGLGLAISRDFIEAQNGHIWVESAVGQGSKFTFSLPVVNQA